MSDTVTTELVIEAAQVLKHKDAVKFAPVIRMLLAQEQTSRRKTRVQRATRVDLAKDGRKVRGGKAYVNLANPDIQIQEGK